MLSRYVKKKTTRIHDNDHVVMHGIICGRNWRNNKCIVQLVKPDFSNMPSHALKNDQRIEVSEKYIKRTPKRNIIEAMINSSSTVETPISSPAPEKKSIKIEVVESNHQFPEPIKRESNHLSIKEEKMFVTSKTLMEEWEIIVGEADAASMAMDSAETCDAWTLADCDSCKRILFCLSYYKLWIAHKAGPSKDNEEESKINEEVSHKRY